MTALLTTALLVPLIAPTAAVAQPAALTIDSYVLPPGAATPALQHLRSPQEAAALDRQADQSAAEGIRSPQELVGPAASYAPRAAQPSAVAPPQRPALSAAAISYPEPAHTMTAEECRAGLGTDNKFYVKSRFAVCSGAAFTQRWSRNRQIVGESQFVVLAVGTIAKSSRDMKVQYYFTNMQQTGTTGTGALMITPKITVPQKWPASAQVTQGGSIPGPQSWQVLAAQNPATFLHSVSVSTGQGTGVDDLVFAVYQPTIELTPPPGWEMQGALKGDLFFLAPRWDTATYVTRAGAAVFSYLATLQYSSNVSAPEKAVADHIKTAYTKPATTNPTNAAKKLPGQSADNPLHRLFHDKTRREKNRSEAIRNCRQYWGTNYAAGGKECDEFPFAVTYEGCAQALAAYEPSKPKNNYSVLPLPKADNGAAGTLLAGFLLKNRLVDGQDDAFIVQIT
ncbi:hypothetical protein [Actinacidiphila glaucinigra]|uniref:hypothetical protein n=1 Tax=Actinacidiphila glaucinigra TaxID=235986 RepID=UPI00371BDDDF